MTVLSALHILFIWSFTSREKTDPGTKTAFIQQGSFRKREFYIQSVGSYLVLRGFK